MTAPGWYPDPSGDGTQRYWDGNAWGPSAPPPAPPTTPPLLPGQSAGVQVPVLPPLPPKKGGRLKPLLLVGGLLFLAWLVVPSGKDGGKTAELATATSAPEKTTAPEGPLKSKLIDLTLPLGSAPVGADEADVVPTIEVWNTPLSVPSLVAYLRAALPIDKPLDGLAYCDENVLNTKTGGAYWYWTDGTGASVNLGAGHYYPETGVIGEGSEITIIRKSTGSEACDAPSAGGPVG